LEKLLLRELLAADRFVASMAGIGFESSWDAGVVAAGCYPMLCQYGLHDWELTVADECEID